MLVILAIFFALFGGPYVSPRDTSGGPSFQSASTGVYDGASGRSDAASFYDGTSGGPSVIPPIEPPSPDGTSGGPSHP